MADEGIFSDPVHDGSEDGSHWLSAMLTVSVLRLIVSSGMDGLVLPEFLLGCGAQP